MADKPKLTISKNIDYLPTLLRPRCYFAQPLSIFISALSLDHCGHKLANQWNDSDDNPPGIQRCDGNRCSGFIHAYNLGPPRVEVSFARKNIKPRLLSICESQ